jgi:hypothetical protein
MRFIRLVRFCVVALALSVGVLVSLPDVASAGRALDEIGAIRGMELEDGAMDNRLSKHSIVIHGQTLAVHGEAARKHVRFACWALQLEGDRLTIFREKGMPTFRHRENDQDRVTEHWTYLRDDVTYVFRGNDLSRVEPY